MTTPYQQQPQAPAAPQGPPQGHPPVPPPAAQPGPGPQPGPPSGQPGHPGQQPAQQVPPQAPPQGAPFGGFAGGPGYVSPIPVRRTHLGHALAAEWTKIRTVRSTVWTLSIMALLVFGIGFLVTSFTSGSDYRGTSPVTNGLFGLMLGQICVITLGVLVVTSEYGTGLIRTTFTAAPQRHRVLLAKAMVFFTVSFTVTTAVCALTALLASGVHSGPEVAEATGEQWAGVTVGAGLYVSLLGLLSLAIGSLLRHSAGAITAMLGLVLLPTIVAPLLMISESMKPLAETMMDYNAVNSLMTIHQVSAGEDGTKQLLVLAGVTLSALIAALAVQDQRDV
ncbi:MULTISPECIES: ABC transporter permease [unclassified Streptomyces]|uniref:ABC transporter permease n=1 Tax=unclassified Streptomyces TaxID=2593676 RepID=UPI000BF3104D|nr:ABC transporter permease [Streptomyces sp. Ru87]PGH48271.1 ABC transporter permease [Streptomyces sp. Ru87]